MQALYRLSPSPGPAAVFQAALFLGLNMSLPSPQEDEQQLGGQGACNLKLAHNMSVNHLNHEKTKPKQNKMKGKLTKELGQTDGSPQSSHG